MSQTITDTDVLELEEAFLKEQYRQKILLKLKRDYLKDKHGSLIGKKDKDEVAKAKMELDAYDKQIGDIQDMITWMESRE